jgi:copper chaperone
MTTTTYLVSGMTCGHCVSAVTEEISKLDGVTGVEVELVAGGTSRVSVASTATPSDAAIPSDAAVAAAVDEAGYDLVGAAAAARSRSTRPCGPSSFGSAA